MNPNAKGDQKPRASPFESESARHCLEAVSFLGTPFHCFKLFAPRARGLAWPRSQSLWPCPWPWLEDRAAAARWCAKCAKEHEGARNVYKRKRQQEDDDDDRTRHGGKEEDVDDDDEETMEV